MNMPLFAAAMVIAATALYHSTMGERRVIAALVALDQGALNPRARRALRFTWHLASLLMLLTAATVAWPSTPPNLVRLIGAAYLLLGLTALWLTRGRHASVPLFTAAGLLALMGAA